MKRLILILAIAGMTFTASAKTNVLDGIQWDSYPGANHKDFCDRYATSLAYDLSRKGIEAWYVVYEWKYGKQVGAHALVVVHVDDKWYIVDNENPRPRWVRHSNDFEKMVRQRYLNVTKIRTIEAIGCEDVKYLTNTK